MSEQNVFKPLRSIKIDNYYYTYKYALVKDYSYRCKHRRKLIYKYKEYLIMIYHKVKESLVKDTKIEKKI